MRARLLPFAAVLLVLLAPQARTAPPVEALTEDGAALRDAFNRDAGKIRLVLLLSPS